MLRQERYLLKQLSLNCDNHREFGNQSLLSSANRFAAIGENDNRRSETSSPIDPVSEKVTDSIC